MIGIICPSRRGTPSGRGPPPNAEGLAGDCDHHVVVKRSSKRVANWALVAVLFL
jgi:hypothetical protein